MRLCLLQNTRQFKRRVMILPNNCTTTSHSTEYEPAGTDSHSVFFIVNRLFFMLLYSGSHRLIYRFMQIKEGLTRC